MYSWNYDFAIVSFIITIVLLVFYHRSRYLPLRQNYYYNALLLVQLVVDFLDVLSSYFLGLFKHYPEPVVTGITTLFFISYAVWLLTMFLYMKSLCDFHSMRERPWHFLFYLPALAAAALYFMQPFTHMFFVIDPESGYRTQPAYPMINFLTVFYAFLMIGFVSFYNKRLTRKKIGCMHLICLFIIIGSALRFIWPELMIMNVVATLVNLILYLEEQNPDLSRDRRNGLFNDYGFVDAAQKLLYQKKRFTCIGISIYNYEAMRTMYGGTTIELASIEIAKYLKQVAGKEYPAFYLMQGRFCVLCIDEEAHENLAQAIWTRFREPWKIQYAAGKEAEVRLQPIVVYFPAAIQKDDGIQVRTFLLQAMKRLEENLPGEVVPVDADMIARMDHYAQVEEVLDQAITNNSIEVYFQPIYSSEKKRITSAEALARITQSKIGFIPPDEFIAIAEHNGTISILGRQIFEKVCRFLKENDIRSLGLDYIEVNLSPIQCCNDDLEAEFTAIMQKYEIEPSLINLEITETATEDVEIIQKPIYSMAAKGITFSLDDYGTGYSNLTQIFSIPFSILKMDKSIVWAYFDKTNQIMEDLIPVFHKNGFKVVAEGIETREMFEKLVTLGCDYQQGFYFSKPLPPEDFLTYITKAFAMRRMELTDMIKS